MSKRQKELFPEITSSKEYVSDIPALAEEWHDTKNLGKLPEDFTSGSNKKVWWKCSKGHEWQTQIYLRAKRGTNCPYCSGQLPSEEHNLLVKYPDIAKEWHLRQERTFVLQLGFGKLCNHNLKTLLSVPSNYHQKNNQSHTKAQLIRPPKAR